MKLESLTQKQQTRIEKYEVGKKLIQLSKYLQDGNLSDIGWGSKWGSQAEVVRIIKRIKDEMIFLQRANGKCNCDGNKLILNRFHNLKQKLEDYKLMEQLE